MQYRSIGPGGFIRQGPGDQQAPIPPAPPRRLVPAKPSPEVADKTSLLELNDRICKWPIGHPGEPDFHFCGAAANPGFPYCVEHCGVAYQAQLPAPRPPPPAAAAVRRTAGPLERPSAAAPARLYRARQEEPSYSSGCGVSGGAPSGAAIPLPASSTTAPPRRTLKLS